MAPPTASIAVPSKAPLTSWAPRGKARKHTSARATTKHLNIRSSSSVTDRYRHIEQGQLAPGGVDRFNPAKEAPALFFLVVFRSFSPLLSCSLRVKDRPKRGSSYYRAFACQVVYTPENPRRSGIVSARVRIQNPMEDR